MLEWRDLLLAEGGADHHRALACRVASHLIAADTNLALVKQALGHKSIGSTMRYVGVTDAQASKATATALMKIF
jgi:site-specific recombinase XerD